jgi:DNA protecting protein DprA
LSSDQLPLFETGAEPTSKEDDLRQPQWLAAIKNVNSIGNKRTIALVEHFKSSTRLIEASEEEIATVIGKKGVVFSKLEPLRVSATQDSKITSYYADDYPAGLRDLDDAPLFLWYRGVIPQQKSIAIVGTRNADEWGANTTRKFSRMAGEAGFVVVSGLALGVDTQAHIGCLEAEMPTVAILACDVNSPTPKSNENLAEEIVNRGGCLIAEVPPGTVTESHALVSRNRLQAAWAKSLLVTQCGIPSGTLHTVRFAMELKRKVAVLRPPEVALGDQYAGNWNLTDDFRFDSRILGGSQKFQEKVQSRKTGADIVIGTQSEFEDYLKNV